MCSIEEGGPKAIIETIAYGISFVATLIGINFDIEKKNIVWYAWIADVKSLVQAKTEALFDKKSQPNFQLTAPKLVKNHSYNLVDKSHLAIYKEISRWNFTYYFVFDKSQVVEVTSFF